jgi:hypothetical protein
MMWLRNRFDLRRSFLGLVLVAASEKGICAILLGDDANRLGAELRSRFRKATLIAGGAGFQEMAAKVVHAVETLGSKLDLPLDLPRNRISATRLAGPARDPSRGPPPLSRPSVTA